MVMTSISCPACSAPEFKSLGRGMYSCVYCGTSFRRLDLVCPACGREVHDSAEICPHCGEPLSVVGSVIARQVRPRAPRWLAVARASASAMKSEAEVGSRGRMDALWEIDRRRLAAQAVEADRRRVGDRRTLAWAAVACGLLVLFFILVAVTR
ncbi:MAG: zinc ribbon domain-containing protein [Anaerolineales bacterium]